MTAATAELVNVVANDNIKFDYAFVPISDLRVETSEDPKTGKRKVSNVLIQDEPIAPTSRFWTSLFARYGFNSAFFKYFDYPEVFDRISKCETNDRMRVCIERGDEGSRLLAVSNPTKPLVSFDDLQDILSRYGGENVSYADGLIESNHKPRNYAGHIDIGGDSFEQGFVLSCPIDGYGTPNVYLSMLRLICQNGLVGYSKAFRSSLSLGKGNEDVSPALVRVLEGFGNEEGYAAIRNRIESSQKSWASIYESVGLMNLLVKLHAGRGIDDKAIKSGTSLEKLYSRSRDNFPTIGDDDDNAVRQAPIFRAFEEMTGNPTRLYGIANVDALSPKRQRTLPVKCTVYDLINFSTEVATHHADPDCARKLQGWVGTAISGEYDMENTREKFTEFKDFHIGAKLENGLTGSEHTDHDDAIDIN